MADLTVFVPSKGRPEAVAELAQTFKATCTADTRLVVVTNYDDPQWEEYTARSILGDFEQLDVYGGRRGMVDSLNQAFGACSQIGSLGFAVGFMGDDHRPRTVGWDDHYLDALTEPAGDTPDSVHTIARTGIVYGNDLLQYDNIPTQVAMTTNIPRKLGYMAPPVLQHLWVDNVWKLWGQGIDRLTYLPETVVEHLHYLNGKAVQDDNYAAVNNDSVARHDHKAFRQYDRSGGLAADIAKLKELL